MNAMIFSTLILPLKAITGGGWADGYFSAIRSGIIASSGIVTRLALSLACVFIAFKFIKMYYDFVSDEQNGGFGGVKTWDLLRPIVILILIYNFGTILSYFDGVCNSISSSLVSNMNATIEDDKLADRLAQLEEEKELSKKEMKEQAREHAEKQAGDTKEAIQQNIVALTIEIQNDSTYSAESKKLKEQKTPSYNQKQDSLRLATAERLGIQDEYMKNRDAIVTYNKTEELAFDIMKSKQKIEKWLKKGGNAFSSIVTWLFNFFFVIMMSFADIMLCLLAVFGPLSLCLSLLDPWKQTFITWIGRYIETSLWKPIGSAICWIVAKAKTEMGTYADSALSEQLKTMSGDEAIGSLSGIITCLALISFAGILALLQVPNIANSILSLSPADSTIGSTAADATRSAATPINIQKPSVSPTRGIAQGASKALKRLRK